MTLTTSPLTVRRLLTRPPEDQLRLDLTGAPLLIGKRDLEPSASEYTVVIDTRLSRRGLMDLLFSIAPYKAHGPDDFNGVLDDWRLFERAATGGASETLLRQHMQGLRGHWQEFGRHCPLFIEVLEDRTETTFMVPVLRWRKDRARIRDWYFRPLSPADVDGLGDLAGPGLDSADAAAFNPLLGFVTLPYFQPQLRRRWPEWRHLDRDGKSNIMGPAQVPVLALLHRRALINSELVARCEAFADEASSPAG